MYIIFACMSSLFRKDIYIPAHTNLLVTVLDYQAQSKKKLFNLSLPQFAQLDNKNNNSPAFLIGMSNSNLVKETLSK